MAQKQDVVIVTINHRLNVFGYLYLGDLGGGEWNDAASVGMLDCVLALKWVKENIAGFGGDPSRVLIYGESGGARKTSSMMAMPPAANTRLKSKRENMRSPAAIGMCVMVARRG